jgi:hypothetical protein
VQTLIIKIDTSTHAEQLANFLKTLPYIKSVVAQKKDNTLVPLTAADWVRPGRPATDEEVEQMLDECEKEIENGLGIPAEKARKQTMEDIKKRRQKR